MLDDFDFPTVFNDLVSQLIEFVTGTLQGLIDDLVGSFGGIFG